MRITLALAPIALLASPVAAQAPAEPIQIPPELTDPATTERVLDMLGPLSKAFMNLPIGEIEAVAAGRPVTPADRTRTIRDVAGAGAPNFEADFQRQIAASRGTMRAASKAMVAALPAISRAMNEVRHEIERATANLPSPVYPQR
jgi:hypothetical protein